MSREEASYRTLIDFANLNTRLRKLHVGVLWPNGWMAQDENCTIERWQRGHPLYRAVLKRSSQREIYKLNGAGHSFALHLVS